ncbi:MAG: DUF1189 family protein [Desulfobacterales bacterium]|nr:DUF1189 family protein [Desulfobacterales bacterium]
MTTYRLIFEGRVQPGHDPETVKQNLADLFGVAVAEVETLFSGDPVVLKEGLDADTARRDQEAFEATGAVCRMEVQSPAAGRRWFGRNAGESSVASQDPDTAHEQTTTDRSPATRRYGLRHPYVMSFYFKPFYRDVALHWRGLAFVHLFVLLALTGVAFMLHFQTIARIFVNEKAPAIIAQLPTIVIEKGQVKVAVEQPFKVFRPDTRDLFAVIDTTGQIRSLRQTDAMLLLTRSQLMARIGPGDSRVFDLRAIETLRLTQSDMAQWLQTSLRWAPFVLYPLTLFFTYCLRTLQVLIYAGIGMVMASLLKRAMPFGATASVAVMAMTPVILIDTLIMLARIHLPLWGIGSFVVAFGYLFFGIRAAAEDAPERTAENPP